jgi:hypothetical protein
MKAIKIGLLSLLLAPAFANDAYALGYNICGLRQTWTPVARGQSYSFTLDIAVNNGWPYSHESPWQYMPLTFYWHGTKNGITDTPPGGTPAMTVNSTGWHYLGTFTNPWNGAWSGTYDRWIVVKDSQGRTYCTSDAVRTVLL